jgi:hypothetical protein
MTSYTHIQRIGTRRSTVVAALVAMTLAVPAAALPATGQHEGGKQKVARAHPMPNGGCNNGGCWRASAS